MARIEIMSGGNQIIEAACMAHVRRKFHDVIKLKPSPIADEALSRIGALYDIEDRTSVRLMTRSVTHSCRLNFRSNSLNWTSSASLHPSVRE